MIGKMTSAGSASLLVLLLAAGAAFACPPTKTWTTGPADDTGLVLAEGPAVTAERIAGPFEVPFSVGILPDGSFLVTERPGRLKHVKPGATSQDVTGVPAVLYVGHGGLLDVAIDTDFNTNGIVYLSYLQGSETQSTIRVMKARFDEQSETLADPQVIFESNPAPKHDQIGGRLALTGDGYLFVSLGDLWEGQRAQDLKDLRGSIVRIRTDGSIPPDNPFSLRADARPEIWSYGHRNPQGLAYDRVTGMLWSNEHGEQSGDEVNLIKRGGNYGWPLATYSMGYTGRPIAVNSEMPGTELPIHYWVPLSVAPSGLAVHTAQAPNTALWISTLAGQMVINLSVVGDCVASERHLLKERLGRIRDVRVDENGAVYVLTDGGEGTLYRLQPELEDVAGKTHL